MSVQWAWPADIPYETRHEAMKAFVLAVVRYGVEQGLSGDGDSRHPLRWGVRLLDDLHAIREAFQADRGDAFLLPPLPALVAASPFDLAVHDAYGQLRGEDIYQTYDLPHLGCDLAAMLEPAGDSEVSFRGKTPADFLLTDRRSVPGRLPAWHLVGGLDPLTAADRTGDEPDDGEPVTLVDWIARDGLDCLKIKLRGTDADWDYQRLVRVGKLAVEHGCSRLTADFNCTVSDPAYVTEILDRLSREQPQIYEMLLYVEQPFPYELAEHPIDVRSVSARKPLFLDESAHDWRQIRLGRELGWTGVALKTCKTQTGAILSACWARAHGMPLMVQDLTNPMLAQIPHCRLAAQIGTIHGVETNAVIILGVWRCATLEELGHTLQLAMVRRVVHWRATIGVWHVEMRTLVEEEPQALELAVNGGAGQWAATAAVIGAIHIAAVADQPLQLRCLASPGRIDQRRHGRRI